jgi:hypothetical protein
VTATLVYKRALSAMIIGARGPNVLMIVSAFEGRRITTERTDDVATACERLAEIMPQVILVFVPAANEAERESFNDRAAAVGALVVHIDPHLDAKTLQQLLTRTIEQAFPQKVPREEAERPNANPGTNLTVPPDVDGGWDS